jgi:hypothetical protein
MRAQGRLRLRSDEPENSLHFRRQKIQAEVFWAWRASVATTAAGIGAQASRLHLECAGLDGALDYFRVTDVWPVAQRFSAGTQLIFHFAPVRVRFRHPLCATVLTLARESSG